MRTLNKNTCFTCIIFLFAFIFNFQFGFSQTEFSKGFKVGYKEGYCHDRGVSCVAPPPPAVPATKASENSNSYGDGYNRGFKMGADDANKSGKGISPIYFENTQEKIVPDVMYKAPYELIKANNLMEAKAKAQTKLLYEQKRIEELKYDSRSGKISFWTNIKRGGNIEIYVDGYYMGTLTSYFKEGTTPSCGQSGTIVFEGKPGTYNYKAYSNRWAWSGTVTVHDGDCFEKGFIKKVRTCTPENAFGLDIGIGTMSLGIRYLHHFSPYFGIDFVKINAIAGEHPAIQFMAGMRGNTSAFYKCMSGYGALRAGYGLFYGFCCEAEIGINLTRTFFMGYSYNYQNCGQQYDETANAHALRIGFNFGR